MGRDRASDYGGGATRARDQDREDDHKDQQQDDYENGAVVHRSLVFLGSAWVDRGRGRNARVVFTRAKFPQPHEPRTKTGFGSVAAGDYCSPTIPATVLRTRRQTEWS